MPSSSTRSRRRPLPQPQLETIHSMEGSDVDIESEEDAIIRKIFHLIPSNNLLRYCVDIGAGDGTKASSSHALLTPKQKDSEKWFGVLLESEAKHFAMLKRLHKPRGNRCLNMAVSINDGDKKPNLVSILQHYAPDLPADFDLLCISGEGPCFWILFDMWSIGRYYPKMICVTFNSTMPNDLAYVPRRDDPMQTRASLGAFVQLASQNGYEFIATTKHKAFFVQGPLYQEHFRIVVPNTNIDAVNKELRTPTLDTQRGEILNEDMKREKPPGRPHSSKEVPRIETKRKGSKLSEPPGMLSTEVPFHSADASHKREDILIQNQISSLRSNNSRGRSTGAVPSRRRTLSESVEQYGISRVSQEDSLIQDNFHRQLSGSSIDDSSHTEARREPIDPPEAREDVPTFSCEQSEFTHSVQNIDSFSQNPPQKKGDLENNSMASTPAPDTASSQEDQGLVSDTDLYDIKHQYPYRQPYPHGPNDASPLTIPKQKDSHLHEDDYLGDWRELVQNSYAPDPMGDLQNTSDFMTYSDDASTMLESVLAGTGSVTDISVISKILEESEREPTPIRTFAPESFLKALAIDMSAYCVRKWSSDTDKSACASLLTRQLRTKGVAMVRGTGISRFQCIDALNASHLFLQEAGEPVRRSCLAGDRRRRGYSPMCTENSANSDMKDMVRKFRIGTGVEDLSSGKREQGPADAWPNEEIWNDEELEYFRGSLQDYRDAAFGAAVSILDSICQAVLNDLPQLEKSMGVLSKQKRHLDASHLTVVGCRRGSRHIAQKPLVAPSTEDSIITIMMVDGGDCALFQHEDDNGVWRDATFPNVVPDDPIFMVCIGDQLQELSKSLFASRQHRIIPASGTKPANGLLLSLRLDSGKHTLPGCPTTTSQTRQVPSGELHSSKHQYSLGSNRATGEYDLPRTSSNPATTSQMDQVHSRKVSSPKRQPSPGSSRATGVCDLPRTSSKLATSSQTNQVHTRKASFPKRQSSPGSNRATGECDVPRTSSNSAPTSQMNQAHARKVNSPKRQSSPGSSPIFFDEGLQSRATGDCGLLRTSLIPASGSPTYETELLMTESKNTPFSWYDPALFKGLTTPQRSRLIQHIVKLEKWRSKRLGNTMEKPGEVQASLDYVTSQSNSRIEPLTRPMHTSSLGQQSGSRRLQQDTAKSSSGANSALFLKSAETSQGSSDVGVYGRMNKLIEKMNGKPSVFLPNQPADASKPLGHNPDKKIEKLEQCQSVEKDFSFRRLSIENGKNLAASKKPDWAARKRISEKTTKQTMKSVPQTAMPSARTQSHSPTSLMRSRAPSGVCETASPPSKASLNLPSLHASESRFHSRNTGKTPLFSGKESQGAVSQDLIARQSHFGRIKRKSKIINPDAQTYSDRWKIMAHAKAITPLISAPRQPSPEPRLFSDCPDHRDFKRSPSYQSKIHSLGRHTDEPDEREIQCFAKSLCVEATQRSPRAGTRTREKMQKYDTMNTVKSFLSDATPQHSNESTEQYHYEPASPCIDPLSTKRYTFQHQNNPGKKQRETGGSPSLGSPMRPIQLDDREKASRCASPKRPAPVNEEMHLPRIGSPMRPIQLETEGGGVGDFESLRSVSLPRARLSFTRPDYLLPQHQFQACPSSRVVTAEKSAADYGSSSRGEEGATNFYKCTQEPVLSSRKSGQNKEKTVYTSKKPVDPPAEPDMKIRTFSNELVQNLDRRLDDERDDISGTSPQAQGDTFDPFWVNSLGSSQDQESSRASIDLSSSSENKYENKIPDQVHGLGACNMNGTGGHFAAELYRYGTLIDNPASLYTEGTSAMNTAKDLGPTSGLDPLGESAPVVEEEKTEDSSHAVENEQSMSPFQTKEMAFFLQQSHRLPSTESGDESSDQAEEDIRLSPLHISESGSTSDEDSEINPGASQSVEEKQQKTSVLPITWTKRLIQGNSSCEQEADLNHDRYDVASSQDISAALESESDESTVRDFQLGVDDSWEDVDPPGMVEGFQSETPITASSNIDSTVAVAHDSDFGAGNDGRKPDHGRNLHACLPNSQWKTKLDTEALKQRGDPSGSRQFGTISSFLAKEIALVCEPSKKDRESKAMSEIGEAKSSEESRAGDGEGDDKNSACSSYHLNNEANDLEHFRKREMTETPSGLEIYNSWSHHLSRRSKVVPEGPKSVSSISEMTEDQRIVANCARHCLRENFQALRLGH